MRTRTGIITEKRRKIRRQARRKRNRQLRKENVA
jgi:hypothetical protein